MAHPIVLRPLQPSDEDDLYALVKKNQTQLIQWLDWAAMIHDQSDFSQFFHYYQSQVQQQLMEVQVICHQKQVIGIVEAHEIDYSSQSAYLSYWLDSNFQQKGIMSQAISNFLAHLYSSCSLKHFFLIINCQNTRSIRLAQKLGFHLEGYASELQFEAQFLPDSYFFHLNYQP